MALLKEGQSSTYHIVLASDNNFVQHMTCTIASILDNANDNSSLHFYILSDKISNEEQKKLKSITKIKPATIEIIDISLNEMDGFTTSNRISRAAYARLKIPTLLPDLSKVIYLDGDIIVRKDLKDLWNIDLGNAPIAAGLDYMPQHKIDYLGIDANLYFNSGVMVINIDAWRKLDLIKKSTTIFNKYKVLKYYDQDILNILFHENWKCFSPQWNCFADIELRKSARNCFNIDELKQALKDPAIIHYRGLKPWFFLCRARYKKLYWKYLAMTEYKDYKYPDVSLENFFYMYAPKKLRKLYRSIKKRCQG